MAQGNVRYINTSKKNLNTPREISKNHNLQNCYEFVQIKSSLAGLWIQINFLRIRIQLLSYLRIRIQLLFSMRIRIQL